MLRSVAGSRSPSTANPRTTLPDRIRTSPRSMTSPLGGRWPVSSWNSRRAASRGASWSSMRAPFGSDQAPPSRRDQIGPPGWAIRTSIPSSARRKSSRPADSLDNRRSEGVGRTRKRPKEPYRTPTPTTLPSKPGLVAAAPLSGHLVSLAAIVAAVREPGPAITHRSGVDTTGPFGQDEPYPRPAGCHNGLVHASGRSRAILSTVSKRSWTTCGRTAISSRRR